MQGIREIVESAKVHFPGGWGQGVLIQGGMVVTAAHCIPWDNKARLAFGAEFEGDYAIDFTTFGGQQLKARPILIEAVSDVAVLGPLDEVDASEHYEAFGDWVTNAQGLLLWSGEDFPRNLSAFVSTQSNEWVSCRFSSCILPEVAEHVARGSIEYDAVILNGDSGGPIVSEGGELLGVVSVSGEIRQEVNGHHNGNSPFVRRAIPNWIQHISNHPDD